MSGYRGGAWAMSSSVSRYPRQGERWARVGGEGGKWSGMVGVGGCG